MTSRDQRMRRIEERERRRQQEEAREKDEEEANEDVEEDEEPIKPQRKVRSKRAACVPTIPDVHFPKCGFRLPKQIPADRSCKQEFVYVQELFGERRRLQWPETAESLREEIARVFDCDMDKSTLVLDGTRVYDVTPVEILYRGCVLHLLRPPNSRRSGAKQFGDRKFVFIRSPSANIPTISIALPDEWDELTVSWLRDNALQNFGCDLRECDLIWKGSILGGSQKLRCVNIRPGVTLECVSQTIFRDQ